MTTITAYRSMFLANPDVVIVFVTYALTVSVMHSEKLAYHSSREKNFVLSFFYDPASCRCFVFFSEGLFCCDQIYEIWLSMPSRRIP